MPKARHPALPPALLWLTAAIGYYSLARLSWRAGFVDQGVPLILLAQGISFASVQRYGPWLATAVAAGGAAEGISESRPLGGVLLIAAAAASVGLAAYAVTQLLRLKLPQDERLGDTLVRFAGAVAGALAGASFYYAANLVDGRSLDSADDWVALLLANLAGTVLVAPFIPVWLERTACGVAGLGEWGGLLATAAGIAFIVNTGALGANTPASYFIFPIVVWAALRTGRMGVTAVVLVTGVVAVGFTANGRGPFVGKAPVDSAISVDSFLLVLALTGLLLVALEHERWRTETGLTESERRHRTLLERLPLVTYVRRLDDLSAPPVFQSPQVEQLLGYPVERWYDEPGFTTTIVHPDDVAINAGLNERARTEDVQGEYRMIRADGRVVWVLDQMVVVRDAAGRPVEQQGFVIDISERKALEAQLGRAQRLEALGLLAGGVAHDFNNLLTAISGYTSLALDHGGRDNERIRDDLHEVTTAATRAADLTRQLLAFGRRQVLARTVVDLNDVVREAQALLDRVIGEQVSIVTKLDPELTCVLADAGQLGQVLVNLAVNARDAMPNGGILTIETRNENGNAVVSVSDTGCGMDDETRARIFEPFFTTKGVGAGSGLGLAMVHGIVQQSDGDISVESSPGNGAAFRIVLPGTVQPSADDKPEPLRSPRGSETVLLVEDEEIVRRLVAEMLRGQGYDVIVAEGPHEALDVQEPYDLLLTDVVMPLMGGPELAEQLLERHPEIGVLFTSGYSGAAVADRGALPADLLEKPFTIEQLAAKVREALDARGSIVPLG